MAEGHALRYEDALKLRRSGFLPWEIKKFDEAKAPDGSPQQLNVNTKTWQAAMESRRRWVGDKMRRGWTPKRIAVSIIGYYVMHKGASPFDFIKVVYKPPKGLTDYQQAAKARAQRRVSKWDAAHRGGARRKR